LAAQTKIGKVRPLRKRKTNIGTMVKKKLLKINRKKLPVVKNDSKQNVSRTNFLDSLIFDQYYPTEMF
jgi:hypothetical protein